MPVSAVAAGRARDRGGTTPHGSDIMADALAEEEVARTAEQFMAGQSPPPMKHATAVRAAARSSSASDS